MKAPAASLRLHHGAGGPAMRSLIAELFARSPLEPPTGGIGLAALDDGAALRLGDAWLVVTTDSHVVKPLFFPGGDIGRLAVCGSVNDLAMMGATSVLAMTCAVIAEEGLALSILESVQDSIEQAAREAHAPIVAGDTKVMGRGEIDGLALNTTAIGVTTRRPVSDAGLRPGDKILVTGSIADHGLAVLAARQDLGLASPPHSDVAPLNDLIAEALAAAGDDLVAMKDPTRGGVASALREMAAKSGVGVMLDEAMLPVRPEVRGVAELLGIDPLHVANEGKALIGVRPHAADRLLAALRGHPLGKEATCIGECLGDRVGQVVLDTGVGRRLVTEPQGELLPRIC